MTATSYPVDSQTAREQREAEAERLAEELEEQRRHAAACRDGWLGSEDAPRLCPRCRPRAAEAVACSVCGRSAGTCARLRDRPGAGACCDRCDHAHGGA